MPTSGDTTSGGDTFPCDPDRALLDRFTLSEAGTADSISAYFDASTTAGTSAKGLIYTDSSGPSSLVAASASGVAVPAGGGWVTLNLAGESLSAGNYWLGSVTNNSTAVWGEDATGSAPDAAMANGTLSYTSPPSTWPGTSASYAVTVNVYCTYTVAGGSLKPRLSLLGVG